MNRDKTTAIIVAAGSGSRMGSGVPKQFRELGGKPLLFWSLQAFSQNPDIDEIIIVTREGYEQFCQTELVNKYDIGKVTRITAGGNERRESVGNGLKALSDETATVLIHDGARPFVTQDMISRTVAAAKEKGACTVAVPVKDTIKTCVEDVFTGTPERSTLYAVQTPQGFSRGLIEKAHREAECSGFNGTDDTVLVDKMGERVYLVKGEYSNIKITTEEDMVTGEATLAGRPTKSRRESCRTPQMRVGTGYDVHAFAEDRKLILGGIEIPHTKGLFGHSDADVLVHAIMDALLGACALGDIGKHFPDTDAAYKGISSLKLLAEVKELLDSKGYGIGNLDCVVIAQKPKILPYIEAMRTAIADVLAVDREQINIKGTTTEKLGFCGREEGIAAQTVAVVYKV